MKHILRKKCSEVKKQTARGQGHNRRNSSSQIRIPYNEGVSESMSSILEDPSSRYMAVKRKA